MFREGEVNANKKVIVAETKGKTCLYKLISQLNLKLKVIIS